MDELDDEFELAPDEDVQSLLIQLTPMGFSTECPGMEVGQVTAIHIETTHSRSVTFRSPDSGSLPPQKLQHQYQSNPAENLAAISWIMNEPSDRVRAVMSTNGRQKAAILVPELQPPFDQVQKLRFEQSATGCSEAVVAVEACFRDAAIIGLCFVYASGARTCVGDVDTDARETVRFARDARVIGLSVAVSEGELVEIEFEVERDEPVRYGRLRLARDPPSGPVSPGFGDSSRKVWCKDAATVDSYQRVSMRESVYRPPSESRLVGIYVGCQEFSRVGALYEPEVSR